jgi:hypothetical protein
VRQLLKVGIQGAGIGVEILVRRELGGIDEDADHDRLGAAPRFAHQRQMAFMQGTQGGTMPMRGLPAALCVAKASRRPATVVTTLDMFKTALALKPRD